MTFLCGYIGRCIQRKSWTEGIKEATCLGYPSGVTSPPPPAGDGQSRDRERAPFINRRFSKAALLANAIFYIGSER